MARKKQRKRNWLVEGALPAETVPRRLRVEGDVHQQLAIALRELADPRLRAAAITRVQMTDDLQLVNVFVRAGMTGDDSIQVRDGVLAALEAARKRLRRFIGTHLALRYTPDLRFFFDHGQDAAQRVDELLAEIASDRASQAGADGPDEPGAADAAGAASESQPPVS